MANGDVEMATCPWCGVRSAQAVRPLPAGTPYLDLLPAELRMGELRGVNLGRRIWRDPALEGMTPGEQMKWGGRQAAKALMRAAKELAEKNPEAAVRVIEKAAYHWEMSDRPWRAEICRSWVAAWRRGA